ncbi:hypothetical protein P8452_59099 [Trifolium repens]|jgi:hypothetical protein|nr:hypothetical protein QL285_036166 [Trifolium repens]WJX75579.1 hypothetical protein P8452_59099 [Trifolium repens]
MDHQHTLQLNGSETPSFMCSGCKELGSGSSYICENKNCNFIVHKECSELVIQAIGETSNSNNGETTAKPKRRRMRSFMKFTGKLAFDLALDLCVGDFISPIFTIGEAAITIGKAISSE